MPISTETRGHIVIFRPHGPIDKPMAVELDELLGTAIDDGALHLAIDFSDVAHVGSDGLKAMLGSLKRLQPLGGRIVQFGAGDEVRALLDVAGFLPLLGEFETADTAIAALQVRGAGPV
jgi:anti-sigma B factor antagonist